MSTTIENKVVEMSFNNSDFEKNAQKSIDTTEKLKKSLDFSGAGKGLDELGNAAKNVNIGVIGTACEAVGQQFNAMKSLAVFALYDIYNMATRTANQLVQTFAIQPVGDGFAEYELKMGSVQTIMASTGASLQEVNGYLDELNLYADKTIYSFSDMTNNIGKFTNAGVSLDMAVKAIQGISNEAAVSGANTNEASRAMYNFAQALSAGYVKLIDWKSIENANMATKEFKQELIDTATELGTLEKQADGTYKVLSQSTVGSSMKESMTYAKNFNDSLQYQWMTTDVLTKTLAKYSDETTEIGKKAFAAATEVKTFSMMMDTLKEAAGSGWTETWETFIGDFNQAKKFWTKLTDYFSDIISQTAQSRNDLLKGALDNDWESITGKIEGAGVKLEDFENKVKSVATERGIAVDEVIQQAGSLGEAFAKGELPVDLVTDAITRLGAETDLGSSKAKSLNNNLGLMLDNIQEKSGRTLLQESLYNVLDSIKTVIEGITGAWRAVDEGFTSSKLYDVLTKVNQATKDFKQYIFDNLADPWDDVEQAITDAGMTVDEFQDKLIETGDQNGVDVQGLIDQYGSLQEAFSEGALSGELVSKMFDNISSSADSANGSAKTVTKTIENIGEVLSDYQKVVDGVWNGDWKNAPYRYQLLADAGYDYQKVQALVNRTVDKHRITLEDLNAVGIETTETTQEQNEALLELANSAKESGTSINDALNKLGKKTGLQLAVEAAHDVFITLKTVVESFGKTFMKVFDSSIFNHFADSAYSAVSFIEEQTGRLANYITSNVDKLNRTFEGPLKVVKSIGKDIVAVAEGILKVIGKVFNQFSKSAPDVLNVTANIGDFFGKLADGLDVADEIEKFFDWLVDKLPDIPKLISDIADQISKLPIISDLIDTIKSGIAWLADGNNPFAGLSDGLFSEIDKIKSGESTVNDVISGFGKTIVGAIQNAVQYIKDNGIKGIVEVFSDGGAKLKDGLGTAFGGTSDLLDDFLTNLSDFASKLIPVITTIAPIAGSLWMMNNTFDVIKSVINSINNLAGPLAKLNDVWSALVGFIGGLKKDADKLTNALRIAIISESLINVAIAVGAIALAVAAFYGMAKTDPVSFGVAIAGIVVCMGMLTILVGAASMIKPDSAASIAACGVIVLAIGISIKLIASALSDIASIDSSRMQDSIRTMIDIAMIIGILTVGVVRLAERCKDIKGASKKINTISNVMLKIGASFVIMAFAMKIIGSMDDSSYEKAMRAIGAITMIMVALTGASFLLAISKAAGMADIMKSFGKSMLAISGAFAIMAGTIFVLGLIDPEIIARGTVALYGMVAIMAILMLVYGWASRIAGGSSVGMAGMLAVAGSMAIMGFVATQLGKVDPEQFKRGYKCVAALAILVSAMMLVATKIGGNPKKALGSVGLLAMSIAIGILAGISVMLGMVDPATFWRGYGCVAALSVLVDIMAVCAGKMDDSIGTKMLMMAAAVAALAVIAAAFTLLDPKKLYLAVGALSILMVCFGLMSLMIGQAQGFNARAAGQVILMVAVVSALGAIVAALSNMTNVDAVLPIAFSMSVLIVALAGAVAILTKVGNGRISDSILENVVKIGMIMTVLGALVMAISNIPGDIPRAVTIALSMCAMINALASAMLILSLMPRNSISNSVMTTIGEMAIIMGALGIVVTVCATLGAGANIGVATAVALSMCAMINALASAMLILSLMPRNSISNSVMTTIGEMAIIMGALGIVVTVCATLGAGANIGVATAVALSMCAMINALASAMLILSLMQNTKIDASVIVTIGILGAIMAALGLLVTYLSTLGGNVESAIATAASMSVMIIALSTAAVILGNYRGSIQSGMSAIVVLTALITAIIAVAAILGELSQMLGGGFMETLSAGMDVLVMITGKIGEAIGSFIGGLGNGLADQFVSMITKFASGVIMFNMAMATVDPNATQSAKNLADALGALAMVDFTNGLIFGQSDPSSFIKSAIQLGMGLQAFQIAIMGVNVEKVSQGAQAVKVLVEGLSTIPTSGGLLNGILGTADYSKFASGASQIGTILPAFVESTKGISGETVAPAAEAIKTLIDTLNGIEPSGGLLQSVLGGTDYAGFANSLGELGKALPSFVESAGSITADTVAGPVGALSSIISTLHDMPEMNGWLSGIMGGTMDVNGLKSNLPLLGHAIKGYADNVAGADYSAAETATESMAKVLDQLRRLSSGSGINIDDVNTFKTAINDLASIDLSKLNSAFSSDNTSNLSNIGTVLGDSIKGGLETAKSGIHESVNSLILDIQFTMQNNVAGLQQTGTQMVNAIATGMQSDTSGIPTVVNTIITEINNGFINSASMFQAAGANIASFFKMGLESSGGIGDSMTTALSTLYLNISNQSVLFYSAGANICAQFGQGILAGSGIATGYVNAMMYQVSSAASSLSGLMQSAGTQAMARFGAGIAVGGALAAAVAKSQAVSAASVVRSASVLFYSAGANCMIQAVSGIRAGGAGVPAAATSTMSSACSAIRGYYGSFYSAGSYCTEGLANGISSGRYRVVSAAQVVAGAAVQAAMHKLNEHSPSRVFMQIGDYAAQGLAIGMTSDRTLVENAASKMAGYSIDAATTAANAFNDLGTSIIPTIDYSSLSKNTGRLDFSATMNRLVSNPMKSSAELMAETQAKFDASNQRVVDSLTAVQGDLARYTNAVENTENAIYVDGKKLASSIAKPMNKELGVMSKRSRL